MKNNILLSVIMAAAVSLHAETNTTVSADEIIGETIKVFQAEGWTAQDVADAVKSLRGLYVRDNSTKTGRERWHGKVVSTSIDTNSLKKVTVYEDGEVFEDAAKIVTPTAAAVAANAKLQKAVMTNGIPARLAAARLRRQAESQAVSNVTVWITADKE